MREHNGGRMRLCSRGMKIVCSHSLDNLIEVEILTHIQVLDDLLM